VASTPAFVQGAVVVVVVRSVVDVVVVGRSVVDVVVVGRRVVDVVVVGREVVEVVDLGGTVVVEIECEFEQAPATAARRAAESAGRGRRLRPERASTGSILADLSALRVQHHGFSRRPPASQGAVPLERRRARRSTASRNYLGPSFSCRSLACLPLTDGSVAVEDALYGRAVEHADGIAANDNGESFPGIP